MSFFPNASGFRGASASQASRAAPPVSEAIADLTARIESINMGIEHGNALDINTAKKLLREYDKIEKAPQALKDQVKILKSMMPLSQKEKEARAASIRTSYEKRVGALLTNPLDSETAKQASVLLAEIHKLRTPLNPPLQTSAALQTRLDLFYVTAVDLLLDPLRVVKAGTNQQGFAPGKLGREGMPTLFEAVQLLIEMQPNELGDPLFIHHRNQLEKVINGYVPLKFKNPQDEQQVSHAIELLAFSRSVNRGYPMPFESAVLRFIDVYVEAKYSGELFLDDAEVSKAITLLSLLENMNKAAQQREYKPTNVELRIRALVDDYARQKMGALPNRFSSSLPPVGIPNIDGASCFAASWMQLIANHGLLSIVYKGYFSPGHAARDVLDAYHQAQREKAKPENIQLLAEVSATEREKIIDLLNLCPKNIVRMREALQGAQGQQDANELANNLHSQISIAADGTVAGRKFGAKIIEEVTHLTTNEMRRRPYSADKATEYVFPSLELNFNPKNPLPNLSSMMSDTHLHQVNDTGTVSTSRSFAEVPHVFVYRFTRLQGAYVNRTEVDVPLYQEITATNGHKGVLQLQGFIRHFGGANGGHYVSYIAQNGKFWLLNDEKVSEISAADYLLAARHATAAVYSRVA